MRFYIFKFGISIGVINSTQGYFRIHSMPFH